METYYNLINELEQNLKTHESNTNDIIDLSKQCIVQCKITLELLRNHREKHPFKNKKKEIEFYKQVKPQVLSHLIFYVTRLDIESKRPESGTKEQIKHLKKSITELQNYFQNNLEFYRYFKSGSTHLDEQYFLNVNKTVRMNIEAFRFYTEEQFSASHDLSVATIMAFTKLITAFKNEIEQLENPHHNLASNANHNPLTKLQWTGTFVQLVEIAYAFQASGCVNNGTADRIEILEALLEAFNAPMGDIYGASNDIRGRKTSKTIFLDHLITMLLKYIEDLDKFKK